MKWKNRQMLSWLDDTSAQRNNLSRNSYLSSHSLRFTTVRFALNCGHLCDDRIVMEWYRTIGLGLKATFLGLECSGLGIKCKAIHYCLKYGTTDHTMYF